MTLQNYQGTLSGIHLYLIDGTSNATRYSGIENSESSYEFGVFKIGPDATSYDVVYDYSNSAVLTGGNESFTGLARRHDGSESEYQSQWFEGYTNTTNNTVTLPGQTGTMYAGIVAANNALHFDGANDFVTGSASSNQAGAFTAEAWLKFNDTTITRYAMTTRAGLADEGWIVLVAGNENIVFSLATS